MNPWVDDRPIDMRSLALLKGEFARITRILLARAGEGGDSSQAKIAMCEDLRAILNHALCSAEDFSR
jgi:hypothetical protein